MTPTPDLPRRRLTYAAPAANSNEALPIGNGRLGAMISGGVDRDRISPVSYTHLDVYKRQVSMSTTSASSALASLTASKATAAGSAPSRSDRTVRTPTR